MTNRTGRVRLARLTDLAALGELSRICQGEADGTRSLGLPVAGPRIRAFSLFRLPLGAFRPNDLLYVYEDHGRIAGLLRAEREGFRDEWTIVELDAVGSSEAGDIRFRLLQQLLREGARRGAVRFHVACADVDENVELFMQAGFVRYGDERILFRSPGAPLPPPWSAEEAAAAGIREAHPTDAPALHRLYATATPPPIQRLEMYRLADWERQGLQWRVPRSSLAPILRFADIEAYVQATPGGGSHGTGLDGFVQVGVAREDQPHYLKVLVRPGVDAGPLVRFGLGLIAARTGRSEGRQDETRFGELRGAEARGAERHDHGVIAPVRTYESPVDRRLEEAGFEAVATVALLLKEALVRVADPALVPAGVRR